MTGEVRLSHGMRLETGLLVAVAEVESGIGCGLVCPECQRRLIAAKGKERQHHFRHEAEDVVCVGALETMRHKLAKQVLAERKIVWQPPAVARFIGKTGAVLASEVITEGGAVTFDAVELEAWRAPIRPDAIGSIGGQELAVEFYVTHQCDDEKKAAFEQLGLAAIEISVSDYHEAIHGDYGDYVLRDAPRWWLFHPDAAAALDRLRAEQARLEALAKAKEEEQQRARDAAQRFWQEKEEQRRRERAAAQEAAEAHLRANQERAAVAAAHARAEQERAALAAAAGHAGMTVTEYQNVQYWKQQTPEQHAAMCDGLRKGFYAHYRPPAKRKDVA